MLAKRVIPTMLVRGRTLVKGERFRGDRSVGHAMQAARVHARRGVDELVILDIGATAEGRGPDLEMVRELSNELFVPLTVGGGVRTLQDIDALLRAGADKVCIGAAAYETNAMISAASDRFGAQAIVVSIDYDSSHRVLPTRTTVLSIMITPSLVAKQMKSAGAGEILLQSVDRDGTMQGYDFSVISAVSSSVDIPVIASGGCSGPEDMLRAIHAGADAVAAGALFQFTDHTPKSCAEYLRANGVEVRLETH